MQIQASQDTGEGVATENKILMPQIQIQIKIQILQILQVKANPKSISFTCMIPTKGALRKVLQKLKIQSSLRSRKLLTLLGIS